MRLAHCLSEYLGRRSRQAWRFDEAIVAFASSLAVQAAGRQGGWRERKHRQVEP
jgi:hypothetical protein